MLELMVVITIIAIATVGVSLALRDPAAGQLDREAQRLAALFEAARAKSRAAGTPLIWIATPDGFRFTGMRSAMPQRWLGSGIVVQGAPRVILGPEPIIGPQEVVLQAVDASGAALASRRVVTDGLRPFEVRE